MCFKQFKAIVNSHSHLLDLLESSKRGYGGEHHSLSISVFSCFCTESYELYTERDVWACIQQVVSITSQTLLTCCLSSSATRHTGGVSCCRRGQASDCNVCLLSIHDWRVSVCNTCLNYLFISLSDTSFHSCVEKRMLVANKHCFVLITRVMHSLSVLI